MPTFTRNSFGNKFQGSQPCNLL